MRDWRLESSDGVIGKEEEGKRVLKNEEQKHIYNRFSGYCTGIFCWQKYNKQEASSH